MEKGPLLLHHSISDISIFMLRKSSVIRDEVGNVDVVVDVDVVDRVVRYVPNNEIYPNEA